MATSTIERPVTGASDAAGEPERVEVRVGPLTVGVTPTVAARWELTIVDVALEAYTVLQRKAANVTTFGRNTDPEQMRDAKLQREAATSAVNYHAFRHVDGKRLTKAQLAPLVTAVRKQLAADVRTVQKDEAKRAREKARAEAKSKRLHDAKAAKFTAACDKAACAVILPKGAKPSKIVSKDQTRPQLTFAYIVKRGDGWFLVGTDTYQATALELTVTDPAAIRECAIATEALKSIEKHGAFRITKQGVQPLKVERSSRYVEGVTYQHTSAAPVGGGYMVRDDLRPPAFFTKGRGKSKVTGLIDGPPKAPPTKTIEVCFDAGLLAAIAAGLGAGLDHVILELDERQLVRGEDNVRRWGPKPLRIRAKDGGAGEAILMPVKHPA